MAPAVMVTAEGSPAAVIVTRSGRTAATAGRCRRPAPRGRSAARPPARPSPRPGPAPPRGRCPCRSVRSARVPGHAIELLEQRGRRRAGRPDPPSSIVSRTKASPVCAAPMRIAASCGAYLSAFSTVFADRLVEEDRIDVDRRTSRSTDARAPIAEPRRRRSSVLRDEVVELEDVAARRAGRRPRSGSGRAGLSPARLRYSTSRSIASALLGAGPRRQPAAGPQGAGRRADGRQRRPQVVRYRLEERRLQLVALARDLRRLRLRSETVERNGLTGLVGCRSQKPRLGRVGAGGAAGPKRPDGAERFSGGLDPNASTPPGRWPPFDPAGLFGAWTRIHRAGSSPGMRRRMAWTEGTRRRASPPVSATTRSLPSLPRPTQTRTIRASARRMAAIAGRTVEVSRSGREGTADVEQGERLALPGPCILGPGTLQAPRVVRRRCRRTGGGPR